MENMKLVPAKETDAEFVYKMMQGKEFKKYFPKRLLSNSLESQRKQLRHYAANAEKKLGFYFIVQLGKTQIGILDIYKIDKQDRRAGIGYGIGEEHWGKGHATKAVKLGTEFMKKKLKLHSAEASVDPKNAPSRKVLEKNGFKLVGIAKDYYFEDGKYLDRAIYWKIL